MSSPTVVFVVWAAVALCLVGSVIAAVGVVDKLRRSEPSAAAGLAILGGVLGFSTTALTASLSA
jgi:hypothetical protein